MEQIPQDGFSDHGYLLSRSVRIGSPETERRLPQTLEVVDHGDKKAKLGRSPAARRHPPTQLAMKHGSGCSPEHWPSRSPHAARRENVAVPRGKELGLDKGTVRVEPPSATWAAEASRLIESIRATLGKTALDVQHVGSTAVAGLDAKPIIDLIVGVPADVDEEFLVRQLQGVGLIYRGDKGRNGGLLFVAEDRPLHRIAHIHVVPHDSQQWSRYLAVRDRLRTDPVARHAYATLKRELAARYPNDRGAYTEGKEAFIAQLLGDDPLNGRS